jgi:hypothetical protein
MARGKSIPEQRTAVEVAESIKTVRHLVGIADQQISKARIDLGMARVRLAELERELSTAGVRP